jgi:hypothetical protein
MHLHLGSTILLHTNVRMPTIPRGVIMSLRQIGDCVGPIARVPIQSCPYVLFWTCIVWWGPLGVDISTSRIHKPAHKYWCMKPKVHQPRQWRVIASWQRTSEVQPVSFELDDQHIRLIDTRKATWILSNIFLPHKSLTQCLELWDVHGSALRNAQCSRLSGVVYMHCSSDFSMGGIATKGFWMFRQLCGDSSLSNVTIVCQVKWAGRLERDEKQHSLRRTTSSSRLSTSKPAYSATTTFCTRHFAPTSVWRSTLFVWICIQCSHSDKVILVPTSHHFPHSKSPMIVHTVLWVPTDLNLHIEAEFDSPNFFSLSLALGINQNFIAYIFYISG